MQYTRILHPRFLKYWLEIFRLFKNKKWLQNFPRGSPALAMTKSKVLCHLNMDMSVCHIFHIKSKTTQLSVHRKKLVKDGMDVPYRHLDSALCDRFCPHYPSQTWHEADPDTNPQRDLNTIKSHWITFARCLHVLVSFRGDLPFFHQQCSLSINTMLLHFLRLLHIYVRSCIGVWS